MATTAYLTSNIELTQIADAIRSKGGTTAQLSYPDEFVSAIGNIRTGGDIQSVKSVTPGTSAQNVRPDSGYDGLAGVDVAGDADLTAANIKTGVNIFGVAGTFTNTPSGKTAMTAASLRSGYAGFINGAQVNGSMADTTVTEGTTTVSGDTATRGKWSQTAGYTAKRTLTTATFASTATSGTNYVDLSATTDAPVLVTGSYLFINKGWTDDVKISLAKLVPDGASADLSSGKILSGYSAYDNDGRLVSGSIPSKSSSDMTISGVTVTAPAGYYGANGQFTVTSITVPKNTSLSVDTTANTAADSSELTVVNRAYRKVVMSNNVNGTVTVSNNGTVAYLTPNQDLGTLTIRAYNPEDTYVSAKTVVNNGHWVNNAVSAAGTFYGRTVVQAGSAATPATTITANPTVSIDANGLVTATASATKSVTPTVSAGYVAAGTAGTITASGTGTLQLTKRVSADITVSGVTVTAPAGYYPSAATKTLTSLTIPKDVAFSVTTAEDSSTDTTSDLSVTNGRCRRVALLNTDKATVNLTNGEALDITWITGKFIVTNGDIGSTVAINTYVSDSHFKCTVIDCYSSDIFYINGHGGASRGRLWCFVDADNAILSQSEASATLAYESITAPTNAKKLIINTDSGDDFVITKRGALTYVTNRGYTRVTSAGVGYGQVVAYAYDTSASTATTGKTIVKAGIWNTTDVTANGTYYGRVVVGKGSATTPATTITANPTVTIDENGLVTATASATQNVTPTVTAGYVSSGTAGTIAVSGTGTIQLAKKTSADLTLSQNTVNVPAGYYPSNGSFTISNITLGRNRTLTVTQSSGSTYDDGPILNVTTARYGDVEITSVSNSTVNLTNAGTTSITNTTGTTYITNNARTYVTNSGTTSITTANHSGTISISAYSGDTWSTYQVVSNGNWNDVGDIAYDGGDVSGTATATANAYCELVTTNTTGIKITASGTATRSAVTYPAVSGWLSKASGDQAMAAGPTTALTSTNYYINSINVPKDKPFTVNMTADSAYDDISDLNVTTNICRKVRVDAYPISTIYVNNGLVGYYMDGELYGENWVDNKYLATGGEIGSTVNIDSPTASNNFKYLIINTNQTRSYLITGKGGTSPRLWCFTDESYNILSQSDAAITVTNEEIVAPTGAKKLIVNFNKTTGPEDSTIIWKSGTTNVTNVGATSVTSAAQGLGQVTVRAYQTTESTDVTGATIVDKGVWRTRTVAAANTYYYGRVYAEAGSAATPATSVTANPTVTIDANGLVTATASATKSVTPTVTAGYVSSGTAGTVTVSGSGTLQLTKRTSSDMTVSGVTITAPAGYYPSAGTMTLTELTLPVQTGMLVILSEGETLDTSSASALTVYNRLNRYTKVFTNGKVNVYTPDTNNGNGSITVSAYVSDVSTGRTAKEVVTDGRWVTTEADAAGTYYGRVVVTSATPAFSSPTPTGGSTATGSGCTLSTSSNASGITIQTKYSVNAANFTYSGDVAGFVSKASGAAAGSTTARASTNGTAYYLNGVTLSAPSSGERTFTVNTPAGNFTFHVDSSSNVTVTEA